MASTTALYTGLSGLTANARSLDVIGNNISNANTTAFKSSRILFGTQFSRTLSQGTVPGDFTGGTSPTQIGLGTVIAGTQRSFENGSLSPTGDQRDLAIDGKGFFIVKRGNTPLYTRAGAFRQNSANDLVNISGERVQGFAVDSEFNIVRGVLTDINVPTGTLTLATATTTSSLAGNLNSSGTLPTKGARITLPTVQLLPSATGPITSATTLVSLADPAAATNPQYQSGQIIELNGAKKGTSTLPTATLTITSATTIADLTAFLQQSLGIDAAAGANPDGKTPGVRFDTTTNQIVIDGNLGSVNGLDLGPGTLHVVNSSGTEVSRPFAPTTAQTADGESVRTSFVVYDSLGNPVTVNLTLALVSKNSGAGTTWRYFAESPDDTTGGLNIGTGTISFDEKGRLLSPPRFALTVDRANTGAASPLTFDLELTGGSSSLTALADVNSNIASTFQNGAPIGTLQGYSVGNDGIITGSFSNGLIRTLGQVAVATFANPEGLVEVGGNLFQTASNSGTPVVSGALELGAGKVVGGSLELSNVELSQEFINLITASTGFSAASRVITTTDQLLQQLLALGR